MTTHADAGFERMYERHRRAILAYCLRRTSREEAYEAANEVFTVAWKRRDDVPRDAVLPWLYGVARRVLAHHRRSLARRTRLAAQAVRSVDRGAPGPEAVVVQKHEHDLVRRAANGLRPLDREMLLLSAWEGLTHAEIAAAMGFSLAAVDKRLARAKHRLKRQYEVLESIDRPPASAGKGGEGA